MTPTMDMDALYGELPTLACKGLCGQIACTGAGMLVSPLEMRRMTQMAGNVRLRPDGCPMLSRGKCRVYDVRPMICRLWGITKSTRCPHGCVPERWLTEADACSFIRRSAQIGDCRG